MFSYSQKPDLAQKWLLFTSEKEPHIESSGHQCLMVSSQPPQNNSLEVSSWQIYSTQYWDTSPNRCLLWKATLAIFLTRQLLYLGICSPSPAQISLGPLCVQWFPLFETHSKHVLLCAKSWFGSKMPSFNNRERVTYNKPGPSVHISLTNSIKQESGSCLLAMYILLSEWTLAPIGVFSGKSP